MRLDSIQTPKNSDRPFLRTSLSSSLLAHALIAMGMGFTFNAIDSPTVSRKISVSLVSRETISPSTRANSLPQKHTVVHTKIEQARIKQRSLLVQQIAMLKTIQHQTQRIQQTERIGYLGRFENKPVYQDYQTYWQRYVSDYGTKNYPEVLLDKHLEGRLDLDIAIEKTGKVRSVKIYRSSGSIVLDNAAIDIAKSAGPYAPLPEKMSQDLDVLHIIRTWSFDSQQRVHFKQ